MITKQEFCKYVELITEAFVFNWIPLEISKSSEPHLGHRLAVSIMDLLIMHFKDLEGASFVIHYYFWKIGDSENLPTDMPNTPEELYNYLIKYYSK